MHAGSRILLLLAVAVCPDLAVAQVRLPRLEVGTSGGAIAALGGDAALILVLGPRLTFNATPRDALEVVAEIAGPGENSGLFGVYLIQVKRVLRPHSKPASAIFLTAGTGGHFQYHRSKDTAPDGRMGLCWSSRPTPMPLSSPPFFVAIGVGFERVLARYAALRGDLRSSLSNSSRVGLRGTLASPFLSGATVSIGDVGF